jgi:hypothetical protein
MVQQPTEEASPLAVPNSTDDRALSSGLAPRAKDPSSRVGRYTERRAGISCAAGGIPTMVQEVVVIRRIAIPNESQSCHSSSDPKNDTFDMNESYDSEDDLSAMTEDRSLRRHPVASEVVKTIDPKSILVEEKHGKVKVMRSLKSVCCIIFLLASAFLLTAMLLISRSDEATTESEYTLDLHPSPTDPSVASPALSLARTTAPTFTPTLNSAVVLDSSTDAPTTAPPAAAPPTMAPSVLVPSPLSMAPTRPPIRRIGGTDPFT